MSDGSEARSDECLMCGIVAGASSDRSVEVDPGWSIARLPRLSSPGAIALVARHHAERLDDLPSEELASFGPILATVSRALQESCEASKVYLFSFGENHPHFHVGMIARSSTLEPHRRGPGLVSSYLGQGLPPPAFGRSAEEIFVDVAVRVARLPR